jgi:hypothetical protein
LAARRAGADDHARTIDLEREEFRKASIRPQDVALFHVGSLFVFGLFFTMLLFVMIGNGLIGERFVSSEFRDGAVGILIAVGFGFAIDLWRLPSMSVNAVQSRVKRAPRVGVSSGSSASSAPP